MKNLPIHIDLFVALIAFCAATSFGQLYYEQRGIMHIDGSPANVTIDSVSFQISGGIISPSGRYLAGFLINKQMQASIDRRYLAGIIDYFGQVPQSSYVLYDRRDERIVTLLDSISYVSNAVFSGSEKWLLIPSPHRDSSILVNTKTGAAKSLSHPDFISFKWFEDKLYELDARTDSVGIIKFDPLTDEHTEDFWYRHNKSLQSKMISPTCQLFVFKNDKDRFTIDVVCRRDKTKSFVFLALSSWELCGDMIFVQGVPDTGQSRIQTFSEFGLYRIDPISKTIELLFSHDELRMLFEMPDFELPVGLRALECSDDEILFIRSTVADFERDIIRWSLKDKTFMFLTDSGYISQPFGVFKEKAKR